jgi:DNA-binding NarL/FixJ family response regulator
VKVLITDDNTLFRKLLRETLHSRLPSLKISEAKDRKEALEMIWTSLPDLIFMDIRLPDGSGLELTRQVKELYPSVKIVILTSYDQREYREAAFRYKADHYVSKDIFVSLFSSILPETLLE